MTHEETEFYLYERQETEEFEPIDYEAVRLAERIRSLAFYNYFETHLKSIESRLAEIKIKCDNKESFGWEIEFSIKTSCYIDSRKPVPCIYSGTIKYERAGFKVNSAIKKGRGKITPMLDVMVRGANELLFIHQRLTQLRNTGLWLPYWFSQNQSI